MRQKIRDNDCSALLLHLVCVYTRPLHGGLDGAAPQLSGCHALHITIINIVSNITRLQTNWLFYECVTVPFMLSVLCLNYVLSRVLRSSI